MNKARKEKQEVTHRATIALLTELTWEYLRQELWYGYPIHRVKKERAKQIIGEYYQSVPAKRLCAVPFVHFIRYCRKVRRALREWDLFPEGSVAAPLLWFMEHYPVLAETTAGDANTLNAEGHPHCKAETKRESIASKTI